ncbi:hypothetical protein HO173_011180 [Letharia columbiana]|uniref:RING-type E3 ubiquitin transferase n=1 Tax=Letharia columbiana TaxID=112416 RepID=A0A8H6FLC7_9LECA|nr:uncharacterized protein HO173_011180 [Letharia columbiana]KAF6230643.1 hypothetical protein HO173_011180 [Letharia columbiana]
MEPAEATNAAGQNPRPGTDSDNVKMRVQDQNLEGEQKGLDDGSPEAIPDIMNDPAYDTNAKEKQKSLDEPDTCRICRGEGSQEEPLFYPCKCSGSIKFVHQNCLMEWLSHSQKKHCELCKTPFHFTKLYHPHMPSTVPLPVFLRQAAIHTWKSFLTWSRFQLVMFVWVVWLPWCMRTIWRGLFWIGDGGWVDWKERGIQTESEILNVSAKLAARGTSPANQNLFTSREATASAFILQISNKIPDLVSPIRRLVTFAAGEPLGLKLLKNLYSFVMGRSSGESSSSVTSMTNVTSHAAHVPRSSSWLSDVKFLRTLTRSAMLNNLIVDALEGQIITLALVTAFILIFLIREWVVQQQPNLFGGAEARVNLPGAQNADAPVQQPIDQRHQGPQGEGDVGLADAGVQVQGPRARLIARPRPRRPVPPRQITEQGVNHGDDFATEDSQPEDVAIENSKSKADASENDTKDQSQGSLQRPAMPDRDKLARAAEIRRTIEEQSRVSEDGDDPGNTFQELWNRAENKPSEVIRIIDEEGRNDELSWIVATMGKIENLSSVNVPEGQIVSPADKPVTATLSNEDNGPNSSRWPSDDEGFVVLDKLSLNVNSEPKDEQSLSTEPPRSLNQDAVVEGPRSPARKSQRSPATSGRASSYSQDHKAVALNHPSDPTQNSTGKSAKGQDVLANGAQRDLDTASSTDAALDSPNDSPFHPEYERESAEENIIASNPGSDNSSRELLLETAQPTTSPIEANEGQAPADFPQGTPERRRGLLEPITDWLWGGDAPAPSPFEQPAGDDEHIVNNIAEEAPFVPMEHGHPLRAADNDGEVPGQDPEVVAAAIQAGLDPNEIEAAEDIEDLEGIMELVGMQGPLAGLVQNGMFCACLVSLTIFFGVWIPYISGKLFLVFLAHPVSLLLKLPLRCSVSIADTIIDGFTFGIACTFYWTDIFARLLCTPIGWVIPPMAKITKNLSVAETAKFYAEGALERLMNVISATGNIMFESDIPAFSVIAHESLLSIEGRARWLLRGVCDYIGYCFNVAYNSSGFEETAMVFASGVVNQGKALSTFVIDQVPTIVPSTSSVSHFHPLHVNLSMTPRSTPLDYDLAYWGTKDRALAVMFGYLFFAFLGVVYLNLNARIKGINKAERVPGVLADVLYQAGGVLKVILIISIEMIVFPLYCGLLLDVALLPLFDSATLMSRIEFTMSSPYTSIFVHWFVGTCYMFHFALFVAMCRKLMRTGVLYFIRDPDDPTFHPVRDVLERSVSTQLWKISFSALVYGGLVIVCLGGVVWGIAFSFDDVLPIHWLSNEPVLEFPVDLLFYNFLMPLAVRFFKPSKGLNKMYNWWFRKCARTLRLTNFLFGEKKEDEEGRHVRRTWRDVLHGTQGDAQNPVIGKDRHALAQDREVQAYFLRDGRYVRAPASDQVRIPKGAHTFLEVDEHNNRLDNQPDPDEGLHGRNNEMFAKVYIPPFFRVRISAFIFLIWLFAAATGVSMTIVPLVFGRFVFAKVTLNHLRMNDIYAFSIGIYILGGALYGVLYHHQITTYLRDTLTPHTPTITTFLRKSATLVVRLLSLIYTYAAFGVLLPALLSLLMEFFLIIPLHTYFSTSFTSLNTISSERHIIHLIQDWTLGILYLKMAARVILYNTPSRPASALRGIIRNGWLNPDVRLATRGFILPAVIAMTVALVTPLALGWLANATVLHAYSAEDEIFKACVYRYSYPGVLAIGFAATFVTLLSRAFTGWRRKIRDEVYLIGERLHNFGDSKRAKGKGKGKAREKRAAEGL